MLSFFKKNNFEVFENKFEVFDLNSNFYQTLNVQIKIYYD